MGQENEQFEKELAKYLGIKYVVLFNSGTSALHGILDAYLITKGDEVIVPSFTFIATANAVLMTGAKPVFADIERHSYGLDPADVEKKITKRTKAIMPVHVGGMPCEIEALRKIADKHHLLLIEDACEALGAKVGRKMVGTFGDASVFSFCQNKVISTGEGGFVATNNKEIANILRLFRNHGRQEDKFVTLGYNFRMPSILAALGISQLHKLDKNISQRRENVSYLYYKLFGQEYPCPKNIFHVFQLLIVNFGKNRDRVKSRLNQSGIGNKVYFEPIHLTPFYKELGYREGSLPVTEEITKQVLSLPMYPTLSRKEMDIIAEEIWKINI